MVEVVTQKFKSTTRSRHRLGFAAVALSSIGWSLGGLFTRLIHLEEWAMLAWRGLFGGFGLLLVLLLWRREEHWRELRSMGWSGWLFVLQSAACMIFYLTALRHTSVANVAVIYATAPFLAAGLGWVVLRERPALSSVVASAIALLGVAIMVGLGDGGSVVGDLLALGMTSAMASTMVVARNFPRIPILSTSCVSSLLSGILCWPIGSPLAVTPHELWLLAAFGVLNFAIVLPLFTMGARILPPIETALIGAMETPIAPFWVWLAFREVPSVPTVIGGLIVFCAVTAHLGWSEWRRNRGDLATQPVAPT
jgi:drug/metabolite transporter (DMT)-like permease